MPFSLRSIPQKGARFFAPSSRLETAPKGRGKLTSILLGPLLTSAAFISTLPIPPEPQWTLIIENCHPERIGAHQNHGGALYRNALPDLRLSVLVCVCLYACPFGNYLIIC